jgi:hypothetical protein
MASVQDREEAIKQGRQENIGEMECFHEWEMSEMLKLMKSHSQKELVEWAKAESGEDLSLSNAITFLGFTKSFEWRRLVFEGKRDEMIASIKTEKLRAMVVQCLDKASKREWPAPEGSEPTE